MMRVLAIARPAARVTHHSPLHPAMRFKSSTPTRATATTASTPTSPAAANGGVTSNVLVKAAAKALRAVGLGPTARGRAQQKILRSRNQQQQKRAFMRSRSQASEHLKSRGATDTLLYVHACMPGLMTMT